MPNDGLWLGRNNAPFNQILHPKSNQIWINPFLKSRSNNKLKTLSLKTNKNKKCSISYQFWKRFACLKIVNKTCKQIIYSTSNFKKSF